MRTFESNLSAGQLRVAVVAARFNQEVVRNLVDGCLERLSKLGCGEVDLLWVPGAFELPLAARTALETGRYDAAVVLGAVIDGRPMVVVMATDDIVEAGIHAGNIAKALAGKMGGGGGGSASVAQAGGKNADQLLTALDSTEEIIRASLENGSDG